MNDYNFRFEIKLYRKVSIIFERSVQASTLKIQIDTCASKYSLSASKFMIKGNFQVANAKSRCFTIIRLDAFQ